MTKTRSIYAMAAAAGVALALLSGAGTAQARDVYLVGGREFARRGGGRQQWRLSRLRGPRAGVCGAPAHLLPAAATGVLRAAPARVLRPSRLLRAATGPLLPRSRAPSWAPRPWWSGRSWRPLGSLTRLLR
jgi:hypothetical protein